MGYGGGVGVWDMVEGVGAWDIVEGVSVWDSVEGVVGIVWSCVGVWDIYYFISIDGCSLGFGLILHWYYLICLHCKCTFKTKHFFKLLTCT